MIWSSNLTRSWHTGCSKLGRRISPPPPYSKLVIFFFYLRGQLYHSGSFFRICSRTHKRYNQPKSNSGCYLKLQKSLLARSGKVLPSLTTSSSPKRLDGYKSDVKLFLVKHILFPEQIRKAKWYFISSYRPRVGRPPRSGGPAPLKSKEIESFYIHIKSSLPHLMQMSYRQKW